MLTNLLTYSDGLFYPLLQRAGSGGHHESSRHASSSVYWINRSNDSAWANLGLPHTDSFGGGLFELRLKGSEGIARVFFCTMVEREIMMLHGFIKKTQKTPEKELKIAKARLKE